MSVAELLADLSAAPDLRAATCADPGVRSIFDGAAASTDVGLYEAALHACWRCPVSASCRAWVEELPPEQRPRGVVAGWIVTRTGRLRDPASRPHSRKQQLVAVPSVAPHG